jgi:hypothetical protein
MTVLPDPVMLFRYSALTGNGHRIHYDHPYVTQVEGYPGLVVHGPLQATLMAQLALDQAPAGSRLARFAYRGRRPCFDGRPLRVVCRAAGAQLPDRAAGARLPDRAAGAQLPDRAAGAQLPDRAAGAQLPDRAAGAQLQLETRDDGGATCMQAEAEIVAEGQPLG